MGFRIYKMALTDELWNADWGFDKKDAGCYVYGLFEQGPLKDCKFFRH